MTLATMTRIRNYRMFIIALLALTVVVAATPGNAQTVVYSFGSQTGDPTNPEGAIAQGRDGALYTTSTSGTSTNEASGTVFKITPAGQMRVLYRFCSQANCADGANPTGGLMLRPDGHFIGTTPIGAGTSCADHLGCGTIFDVSQTGALTTLYTFTGGTDGGNPSGPPILGADGSFYGVASSGGNSSNCGTIYRINGGGFTVLHHFDGLKGCNPAASLVLGTDGNLYGTTSGGGTTGNGVVFRFSVPTGKAPVLTVLYNFDSGDISVPEGALIQGTDGNFYGTASGGTNSGGFFEITPSGTLTVLFDIGEIPDGDQPSAALVQATDGNLYGVLPNGGRGQGGGCFIEIGLPDLTDDQQDVGIIFAFQNGSAPQGSTPLAAPFQHTNGLLYGDTYIGGAVETSPDTACDDNPNQGPGCGVFYSWGRSFPPFVSTVPFMAKPGTPVEILGQGFDSTTTVSFNGTPAAATVVSGTYLKATVPSGATSGFVTVTTSNGTLTSNKQFIVTE